VATFVYSPKVTAFVSITNKKGQAQILDISEDLVSCDLTLRTNAVHTFHFQLQNAQRKYDGLIRPMDRIVVSMRRVGSDLRIFSGYMNDGPIFSVWPRVLDLSASCTLKRLQFWFWDSVSPKSAELIRNWGTNSGTNSPQAATGQSGTPTGNTKPTDGGLRDLAIKLLTDVVGWPKEKIHIGAIPSDWFKFATDIGDEIIKAADQSKLIGTLGGTTSSGGISGGGALTAGTYAGLTINQEQANIAATIYNVAASKGLDGRAAAQGIATGIVESGLRNLSGGDRDSVGVFQQRPSQGWGTVAQCTDVTYAAGKFFDGLVKVPNYKTADFGLTCQAVQRSAFPDKYGKQQKPAEEMVKKIQTSGSNAGTFNKSSVTSPTPGGASGRNVAAQAYNIIKSKAPGYIRYSLGNDDPYNSTDPKVLDCSSFVDVAYYRAVGQPLITPRSTVSTERPKCKIIDVETAKAVKGALLFINTSHVEVSLGNGFTAAAHTDGIPLEKQVNISKAGGGFTDGGLLPGVNYSDAATTQAAAQKIQGLLGYSCSTSDPNEFPVDGGAVSTTGGATGSDQSAADVFNALINVYTWGYQPDPAGQVLAGPRALMNDEPFLPFVGNIMSASMRSWCSAPNGDFMAWFPDYFDLWGITAKMDVRAIELMDFTVKWSDQQIVTHQYVVGVPLGFSMLTTDGSVQSATSGGLFWQLQSQGVATMDFPQIFRAIFGQDASQQFLDEYLGRFGGRPNMVTVPSVQQGRPEFFMALFLFMRRWADQFQAEVPMTFMPELWPGMILRLPEFNFQAYVVEVRHVVQYGENGGFRTFAKIIAPSRISQKENDVFGLLPLGGKKYPTYNPVKQQGITDVTHPVKGPL
jgi:cell wall-associated NlpC family hydrolase